MSLEIKCRIWDEEYETMIYCNDEDSSFRFENGKLIVKTIHEQHTVENGIDIDRPIWVDVNGDIMLFTGLKDEDGTEIYEGDILSYKSAHPKHEGKVFNNVVEFAIGQSLCGWRMRNKSCVVKATPYKFVISKVIGNIYENPELLETQKAKLSEPKVE